jgi:nicotinate-nucleotide pyrophosphorylase (carboxylating)
VRPDYITDEFLNNFITAALAEDIGDGDHTTLSAIPAQAVSRARLVAKDHGIVAGVLVAEKIFKHFDPSLLVDIRISDGTEVAPGDIVLTVSGSSRSILTTERLVLNCMQRMSGIATHTHQLTQLVVGTRAKLLDTRKTTPNFRILEKWAVRIGGGENHRLGLYDMIMLKDNHIDVAGGVERAIIRTKDYLRARNQELTIEIETRTLQEVEEVLRVGGVDIIMLDNMSLTDMKDAIKRIAGRFKTEASGNITEQNIRAVADCGVDYISVGALTHSVSSLDLNLKAY